MKLYNLFIIPFIILMFTGCEDEVENSQKTDIPSESLKQEAPENKAPLFPKNPAPNNTSKPQVNAPQQVNVPADASGRVSHYVCTDGCEGGFGDAAGTCSACGKQLAHNQAFHNQKNSVQQNLNPQISPQQNPEPAQNASGVWHYTCPKGCDGGAGSAIACNKCGEQLGHNQGYHN